MKNEECRITTVRLRCEVIAVSASRDEHLARGIGGVDLNLRVKGFAEGLGRWLPRSADARRQDPVRASQDFLPWSTFQRIVATYQGDRHVRTLSCAEQFGCMAFAQITYRESLRDIEACLSAQAAKLYHMGFRQPVSRSTLADANESRDWRIYAEFVHRLIAQARKLYADDSFGLQLSETVYALGAATIDLCLSVFRWAAF